MSKPTQRKGTVLVAVLVCLGLIGTLMFASVRVSLQQRRQLERELQMEQTRLLADAGLERAIEMIESGSDAEDTVTIRPNLDGKKTSEVKIEFVEQENGVEAKVTAWIGIEGRPELQTRQKLTQKIEKPSGE